MDQRTEQERLNNLYQYRILDSGTETAFDDITMLATKIFNVPIAIISLVDAERIWFKSYHGCASAIMSDEIYIVKEAREDPRTLANPLVVGELGLQFYAGVPLKTREGYRIGTLCIIDKEPRSLSVHEISMLRQLGRITATQIELRLDNLIAMEKKGENNQQENS